MPPALSFVIPLYNSAETIAGVVREIEALDVEGGHEIVLVNDGADETGRLPRPRSQAGADDARRACFHLEAQVLTSWRHARAAHGESDDDGQNRRRSGRPATRQNGRPGRRLWAFKESGTIGVQDPQLVRNRMTGLRQAGRFTCRL
jgi:cellulose synthase/poly-beta-1,6-N-acetylglucosamine synthase-like glycosyltransferase